MGARRGQRVSGACIASGHAETTRAAVAVLQDGGNAFDALIAAAWAACVAEPLLCSPGGGGHALLKPNDRAPVIVDGFARAPARQDPNAHDFFPIEGNFGTDRQVFHIGLGAAAVPGLVAALFSIHARLASRPMPELVGPAIALARRGVVLNRAQHYALDILQPIVRACDGAARLFGLRNADADLPEPGARVKNPELGDFLERLAIFGEAMFYRGEIAATIAASCLAGGHLRLGDLVDYRARWRRPLRWQLAGNVTLWSNPPPAFGGLMVAMMTQALDTLLVEATEYGAEAHVRALINAMRESEARRCRLERPEHFRSTRALRQAFVRLGRERALSARGTTHISVRDTAGNLAGMTLSNGEGCGRVLPGCGFMLNNMLGEQDLNPLGFGRWPPRRRLASMMAPTLVGFGARRILLGSGGSNRIRTALAQVLCNLIRFDMPLPKAIEAPRMHFEQGALGVEQAGSWPDSAKNFLAREFPDARQWPGRSLFFGGVHAVGRGEAAADPRREGAVWIEGD